MTKILPFIFFFFIGCHLAFSQNHQKKVIAIEGDGIYSLLRKNGLDPIKNYEVFITLNKKNLGKNDGLFIGKTYSLPEVNTVISDSTLITQIDRVKPKNNTPKEVVAVLEKKEYSIFGKEHATVTIKDKKLDGAIYYLISGHGGPDPGATATYSKKLISEDEYAYDVTLRLARMLISNGAKVYIMIKDPNDGIRNERILEVDYDEVSYLNKKIPLNQKLRLKQRTIDVNNLFLNNKEKYQRLIVTHIDSRYKSNNIDVFFYHHENSKKGKQLAENIYNSFKQKYSEYQPNRVYSGSVSSRSSLYLVKNTLPPMVYIELGNIRNDKDQKRILNYENRQALAKWIYSGVINDFEQFK